MFRTLSVGVVTAFLSLASCVVAMPPAQPPGPFEVINGLDYSTCSILGKVFANTDVGREMTKAGRQGLALKNLSITAKDQFRATLTISFVTVGAGPFGPQPGPFGPFNPVPVGGITQQNFMFRVELTRPQDAGWMVGEVSPLAPGLGGGINPR